MITNEEFPKKLKQLKKFPLFLCYKGGGYDGCIWEYNYAIIDKNPDTKQLEWISLYHSGCFGAKTLDKFLHYNCNQMGYDELFYCYLHNRKDMEFFAKTYNNYRCYQLSHWINEKFDPMFDMPIECEDCKEIFNEYDMIVDEHVLCEDCYYQRESDAEDDDDDYNWAQYEDYLDDMDLEVEPEPEKIHEEFTLHLQI